MVAVCIAVVSTWESTYHEYLTSETTCKYLTLQAICDCLTLGSSCECLTSESSCGYLTLESSCEVPDIGEHHFEELLGGEDPLGSASRGAVHRASSSHHAVGAAQVDLAGLP